MKVGGVLARYCIRRIHHTWRSEIQLEQVVVSRNVCRRLPEVRTSIGASVLSSLRLRKSVDTLDAEAALTQRRHGHIVVDLVFLIVRWWQLNIVQINLERIDGICIPVNVNDRHSENHTG